MLLRFVSVGFFALFLLVVTSGDFWFAVNEAPRTALRCNRALKIFNVYYSPDEAKLYRIDATAAAAAASPPSVRSDVNGVFQFRARAPVVRSDNMRTWVEESD